MEGFKGFERDLTCLGYQYTIGEKYVYRGEIELCQSGFHFCTHPLNVFEFYPPCTSRYAVVDAGGEIVHSDTSDTTKSVCSELTITREVSIAELVHRAVQLCENTESNTGNFSAATNTGRYSVATNTGDFSVATNTGDYSVATNTGVYSVATNTGVYSAATAAGEGGCAVALGANGRARGAIGCWLTVAEWKSINDKMTRIDVQIVQVDGERILENTFYRLVNGKWVSEEKEDMPCD